MAGAGNAVLAFDANNDGKIDQQKEIIFTQWDPSASTDMQALIDVFDTNHNSQLDAGDAKFSQFKLVATNADGTQTVETPARGGVASINLVPSKVRVAASD
jgi:trimeric autotransporter adhesin